MLTDVFNLATNGTISYSLPPEQAVVAAFEQFGRTPPNWNTWTYRSEGHPLLRLSEHFVFCGDFVADRRPATHCDEQAPHQTSGKAVQLRLPLKV